MDQDDKQDDGTRVENMSSFIKNIRNYVPQEVIDVAYQLFKKFDKENKGYILAKDLTNMLRLMDLNPSKKEIKEMIDNLNEDNIDPEQMTITREGFLVCIARKKRESNTIDELWSAFILLDKEKTGKIPENKLRYYLCKLGEVFENDEMDLFMKEATPFIEIINEVKYLKYKDYALFLKGMYEPPEEDPKKSKGNKNRR